MAKAAPHSLESERAVLGAILLNNEIISHVAPIIRPQDFYRTAHATIYSTMLDLDRRREPIDFVSLVDELRTAAVLDRIGGINVVTGLTNEVPSINHAVSYATKVAGLARKRNVIDAASVLANELTASNLDEDTDTALAAFDAIVTKTDNAMGAMKVSSILGEVMQDIENAHKGDVPVALTTGFPDLDDACPIMPTDLVLVGGRPGMGKTALGLNIAVNSALRNQPALFISVEMPKKQIVQRAVSSIASLDTSKFRKGGFTEKDFEGINSAMTKLVSVPLWIFDRGSITAMKACAEITRMVRREGIKLVIVDHIHQLSGKGKRLDVIAEAAHMFKAVALDTECGVVVLCQLNRGVEERMPPKPQLSDLKETGELEQAADSVWMLYRQDYYETKGFFETGPARKFLRDDLKGIGHIGIDKSRHGPEGHAKLTWDGRTTSYRNMEWRR